MRAVLAVLLCLFSWQLCAHDSPCGAIRESKEKTYNFQPNKVDQKTREAKSRQMDEFWKQAKVSGEAGIGCLRQMLQDEPTGSFFLFDGASLLLSLDESSTSLTAAKTAAERADLQDVTPAGYMSLLIQLAVHDVDIGTLTAKYLGQPNVTAIVPQHAMTLDRMSAALLLYGSMRSEQVDQYAVPLLRNEQPELRAIGALVLATNMTEESFKALKSFEHLAALPSNIKKEVDAYRNYTPVPKDWKPKFTREQVLAALRRIPHSREEYQRVSAEEEKARAQFESQHRVKSSDTKAFLDQRKAFGDEFGPYTSVAGYNTFIKSAILTLSEGDLPFLRNERRKQIGMSDEAFYEWAAYRGIIEGVINRLDLYKEYRVHRGCRGVTCRL